MLITKLQVVTLIQIQISLQVLQIFNMFAVIDARWQIDGDVELLNRVYRNFERCIDSFEAANGEHKEHF